MTTLNAYQLTIRHGRTLHTWIRFASDPVTLIVAAQRACADEWPNDVSTITGWHECPDPRGATWDGPELPGDKSARWGHLKGRF